MLKKFLNDDSGATAIEYALITALIAILLVPGLTNVGTTLNGSFTTISTSF